LSGNKKNLHAQASGGVNRPVSTVSGIPQNFRAFAVKFPSVRRSAGKRPGEKTATHAGRLLQDGKFEIH
jgi:hypothetical protein